MAHGHSSLCSVRTSLGPALHGHLPGMKGQCDSWARGMMLALLLALTLSRRGRAEVRAILGLGSDLSNSEVRRSSSDLRGQSIKQIFPECRSGAGHETLQREGRLLLALSCSGGNPGSRGEKGRGHRNPRTSSGLELYPFLHLFPTGQGLWPLSCFLVSDRSLLRKRTWFPLIVKSNAVA